MPESPATIQLGLLTTCSNLSPKAPTNSASPRSCLMSGKGDFPPNLFPARCIGPAQFVQRGPVNHAAQIPLPCVQWQASWHQSCLPSAMPQPPLMNKCLIRLTLFPNQNGRIFQLSRDSDRNRSRLALIRSGLERSATPYACWHFVPSAAPQKAKGTSEKLHSAKSKGIFPS